VTTVMSGGAVGGGGGGGGDGMDSLLRHHPMLPPVVGPPPTTSGSGGGGGDGDGGKEAEYQQVKALFEKTFTQKKNIYSTDPIPLNNPWTFWVDRTARGANMEQYEANLRKIYTVYTVQRFWAVYYNIPKPGDLQPQSSLHMMRDDRKPLWEETYNCKGGTFRLRVQKKDSNKVWKELLMAAIGEQLGEFVNEKDEVCGVSISIREKEDVLLIWNINAELAKESRLLECLRQILPDTHFLSTFYKPHVTHHAFEKGPNGKKGPRGRNISNVKQHPMS